MNSDIDLNKIAGVKLSPDKFLKIVDQVYNNLINIRDYGKLTRERANYPNIKKLIEELLPIKSYLINTNCSELSWICWEGKDQKGDANTNTGIIEVTTAQLQNDYKKRQELNKNGVCFSAKKIVDGKTQPYAYSSDEHIKDAINLIDEAIKKKASKNYPKQTILVIAIFLDTLIDDDEAELITKFFHDEKHLLDPFKEIFVVNAFKWQPLASIQ